MPLKKGKKNVGYNMHEMMADNMKKGKARGANGKPRSMAQMRAISLSVALGKKKKNGKKSKR